jgi:hypothetical protein
MRRSLRGSASTRLWIVTVLALSIVAARPPGAIAQSLWDDLAFQLARQAQEALQRNDYGAAAALARQAIQAAAWSARPSSRGGASW